MSQIVAIDRYEGKKILATGRDYFAYVAIVLNLKDLRLNFRVYSRTIHDRECQTQTKEHGSGVG
jgi:hypothetical protein